MNFQEAIVSSSSKPCELVAASRETIMQALQDPHTAPCTVAPSLGLFVGNETLGQAEQWLALQMDADGVLRAYLQRWALAEEYDYCLIDCHPGLDRLTTNALVAADRVLVPLGVKRGFLKEHGVEVTFEEVRRIRGQQSVPTEGVCFSLQKPLEEMREGNWEAVVAQLIT